MNVKKTERDGIVRAYPENGKPLAWSASSGVELIEKDGLYFKDLEKTGELLPPASFSHMKIGVCPLRSAPQTLLPA